MDILAIEQGSNVFMNDSVMIILLLPRNHGIINNNYSLIIMNSTKCMCIVLV